MGVGPAWMRRGTQGHVAAPTWRDIHIYIYIYITYYSKRGL